jgi:hypothetical protein
VQDLPNGEATLTEWMAVWARIDNCTEWDAMWLTLITRILKHSGLRGYIGGTDSVASPMALSSASPVAGGGCGEAGFDAAAFVSRHLPFLFSRAQVRVK